MAYQAIQSFSAEFSDGRPALSVNKGEIFPDGHELVRRDLDEKDGRAPGQLFKKLDLGDEEPKREAKPPAKAAAKAEPAKAEAAKSEPAKSERKAS